MCESSKTLTSKFLFESRTRHRELKGPHASEGLFALLRNSVNVHAVPITSARHAWLVEQLATASHKSVRGGESTATMYSLMETTKLNGIDPEATCAVCLP